MYEIKLTDHCQSQNLLRYLLQAESPRPKVKPFLESVRLIELLTQTLQTESEKNSAIHSSSLIFSFNYNLRDVRCYSTEGIEEDLDCKIRSLFPMFNTTYEHVNMLCNFEQKINIIA